MFIGHFAPAMIAARHKDSPSLPVLFIGAQLVDWAFFGLLLTGVEMMRVTPGISVMNPMDLYHMPYTHSLLGTSAWSMLMFVALLIFGCSRKTAGIASLVVLSHWFLDLLVHVPDLTLAGSPPKLGFGLWNHPAIEIPLELALAFGSLWLYAKAARPKTLPLAVLAGVMLLFQMVNWFGPVESEVTTGTSLLAFFAFGLITLAAWWVYRSEGRKQAG